MAQAINTTESIFEQTGFVAFVMGVNGPKASGFGETENEAYAACVEEAGQLDVVNIQTEPKYSCTLPNLGEAWNWRAQQLNEQGYDWESASDNPAEWPVDAIGYYANVQTGNPAIFVTGIEADGAWADPENNNEPVCLECIRTGGSGSVEGEDEPADFIDADDYEDGEEDGEEDAEYKAAIEGFQFDYKKLETPGQCWSCLQMLGESGEVQA